MSIQNQADKALRAAQKRVVKAKLLENFHRFRFQANHVERRLGQEDWTNRLTAVGPDGEVIHNLYLTVKTPGPLEFNRLYSWDLLAFCPLWVEYLSSSESIRWSQNTGRTFKLGR